jgi:hypothetical protein
MGKTYFTIKEAAKMLKIENGRIREWISRYYIIPARPSNGKPSPHFLNQYDLSQIVLFEKLLKFGLNRKKASQFIKSPKDVQRLNCLFGGNI